MHLAGSYSLRKHLTRPREKVLKLTSPPTAMDAANRPFAALRAAAIDGRTRNVLYRQTQLSRLHQKLAQAACVIVSAIVTDTGCSRIEAQIEYSLALTELRRHFAKLFEISTQSLTNSKFSDECLRVLQDHHHPKC